MAVLDSLNAKHGKGSVTLAGVSENQGYEYISTGHYALDEIFGGGFARGAVTEIFGGESAGKTTLALQAVATAQKAGLVAAYIDLEHTVNPGYAKLLGVDWDSLIFNQPMSAEEAMDMTAQLVKSGEVGIIVFDSVAAMATKRQLEGDIGKEHMAEVARLMATELTKITTVLRKSNTALVFINQLREKVGVTFGKTTYTPGGRTLRFAASLRVELTYIEALQALIKGENVQRGHIIKADTVKNKAGGQAHRKIRVEFCYPIDLGKGILQTPGFDPIVSIIEGAVEYGIIDYKKPTYTIMSDGTKFNGREKLREYLKSTPEVAQAILTELTAA